LQLEPLEIFSCAKKNEKLGEGRTIARLSQTVQKHKLHNPDQKIKKKIFDKTYE
jgi:hypothetical protein